MQILAVGAWFANMGMWVHGFVFHQQSLAVLVGCRERRDPVSPDRLDTLSGNIALRFINPGPEAVEHAKT